MNSLVVLSSIKLVRLQTEYSSLAFRTYTGKWVNMTSKNHKLWGTLKWLSCPSAHLLTLQSHSNTESTMKSCHILSIIAKRLLWHYIEAHTLCTGGRLPRSKVTHPMASLSRYFPIPAQCISLLLWHTQTSSIFSLAGFIISIFVMWWNWYHSGPIDRRRKYVFNRFHWLGQGKETLSN
jgi:hypothetical protein